MQSQNRLSRQRGTSLTELMVALVFSLAAVMLFANLLMKSTDFLAQVRQDLDLENVVRKLE
jgi:Tfp pilus assembly protein PilW